MKVKAGNVKANKIPQGLILSSRDCDVHNLCAGISTTVKNKSFHNLFENISNLW